MPRGLEDKFKLLSHAENVLEKLIYFPLTAFKFTGRKGWFDCLTVVIVAHVPKIVDIGHGLLSTFDPNYL